MALGKLAIRDRSNVVRYEGCMLSAYSLSKDVIPDLEMAKKNASNETVADIAAAIDAIKHQNANYFVDRDHYRMVTLNIH